MLRLNVITSIAVFVALSVFGSVASADGGFFIDVLSSETQEEAAADGLLSSSGQRAVLWRTDESCWDLYVEPGTVSTADAAWVLPLPVNPEIGEASDGFIDQLDAATIPIFTTRREFLRMTSTGSDGFCGCGGDSAGAGGSLGADEIAELENSVTIWGQGKIGALEYEVLTTETATALQDWLTFHQYVVPDTLATSIEPYVAEGYLFFVAKIARDEGDASNVATVRFSLCGGTDLWYPMRLSAYSVAGTLDFTLFVVDRSDIFEPTNCSWSEPGVFYEEYQSYWGQEEYDTHREEIDGSLKALYDDRIDAILRASEGRSLAMQYAGVIIPSEIGMRTSTLSASGIASPLRYDGSDWTSEFRSVVDDNLLVTRFVGSFPPSAMQDDVELTPSGSMDPHYATYERYIEIYDVDPPEGSGTGADAMGLRSGQRTVAQAGVVGPARVTKRTRWLTGLLLIGALLWLRKRAALQT